MNDMKHEKRIVLGLQSRNKGKLNVRCQNAIRNKAKTGKNTSFHQEWDGKINCGIYTLE